MNNKKNLILAVVAVLIIAAIFYLESKKPPHLAGNAPDVTVPITASSSARIAAKAEAFSRAKEFVAPDGFINTEPIALSDLIGKKVILVDFWTYSCINCQRTIPYLNAWYQKYKDQGLEIVGVHTPEFDFEKNR